MIFGAILGPVARWWEKEWAVAGPRWKQDARRGFAVGAALGGLAAAWVGYR